MEIVFAILILIGAMAAGSNASTTDEIQRRETSRGRVCGNRNCASRRDEAWPLPVPRRAAHPAGSDGTAYVDRLGFGCER